MENMLRKKLRTFGLHCDCGVVISARHVYDVDAESIYLVAVDDSDTARRQTRILCICFRITYRVSLSAIVLEL